jgi:hypothetical protein
MGNPVAGFLFGFLPNAILRVVLVEQSGTGLDHHAIGISIDVGGKPELSCENDGAFFFIVEKNRGTVSSVLRFPAVSDFFAGPVGEFIRHLPQGVPVIGQNFGLENLDVFDHRF